MDAAKQPTAAAAGRGTRKPDRPVADRKKEPKPEERPRREEEARDEVEEASDESFPASDPPAWTGTTSGGPDEED